MMGQEILDEKQCENNFKRQVDELRKERRFFEVLCQDYISVYYLDIVNETIEILQNNTLSSAAEMFGNELRKKLNYMETMEKYCSTYVVEADRAKFLRFMDRDYIKEKLEKTNRFVFRYNSNSYKSGYHHFDTQIVKVEENEEGFTAILAFRHIEPDSGGGKEQCRCGK